MKALSEMISFWDGRGPSEKKKKRKEKNFIVHACIKAIKIVSLQREVLHKCMNTIYVRADH